jgi:hypothetical protein
MGRRLLGSFSGLAFVPLLAATPSFAEPSAEAIKMARKRFQEGVAAVDAGNYETARVAFQQAYALKPHPSVLRNLGQAELKTGRHLEAARHLSTFVRETAYGTGPERESAARSLAQAEAEVGKIVVEVDVPGAEITVDGERAGRSPIVDPFYAERGDRIIRIQKDGYETYEKVQPILAGRTTQLKISLEVARVATPAASVSGIARSLQTPPSATAGAASDGIGPPPAGLVPESDSKIGARSVALVTTGGLALISAGVWLGFGVKGAQLQSQADELREKVESAHPDRLPGTECGGGEPPCDELRDVNDKRATANTFAWVGGIATGISAGAFGAALLLWPKSKNADTRAELVPALSGNRAGVELRGAF